MLLNFSVFQRCTPMHTVGMQQADTPGAIPKSHQLLTQDFQETRRVGELHGHAHRVPETSHVFTQGRTPASFGEFRVMPCRFIGVVPPKRHQLFFEGWCRQV